MMIQSTDPTFRRLVARAQETARTLSGSTRTARPRLTHAGAARACLVHLAARRVDPAALAKATKAVKAALDATREAIATKGPRPAVPSVDAIETSLAAHARVVGEPADKGGAGSPMAIVAELRRALEARDEQTALAALDALEEGLAAPPKAAPAPKGPAKAPAPDAPEVRAVRAAAATFGRFLRLERTAPAGSAERRAWATCRQRAELRMLRAQVLLGRTVPGHPLATKGGGDELVRLALPGDTAEQVGPLVALARAIEAAAAELADGGAIKRTTVRALERATEAALEGAPELAQDADALLDAAAGSDLARARDALEALAELLGAPASLPSRPAAAARRSTYAARRAS